MRLPSAGTGRQELAMNPSATRKDHFFPRVNATARMITRARRGAGITRQELADAAGISRTSGRELIRRLETGRYPFPAPELMLRIVARLGLDADAVFLAQCQDFEELDRSDPRLLVSVEGRVFSQRPPPGLSEAGVRDWALALARRQDEAAFARSGGLWTTKSCLTWPQLSLRIWSCAVAGVLGHFTQYNGKG